MDTKTNIGINEHGRTQTLVITGLLIALTYVFTAFVNIRLPIMGNGGLIHLGNVPLFLGAILYGRKTGALTGGIGMALFDVTSGWALWAPFTLVIAALMGYVTGVIAERQRGARWYALAVVFACVIKLTGYYLAEGVIYGNWIAPLGSIPGNMMQILSAAVLVLPVAERIRRVKEKINV